MRDKEHRSAKEMADHAQSLMESHPDLFSHKFDTIYVHTRCNFEDYYEFPRRFAMMKILVERGVVRKCWQRGKYELLGKM